MTSSPGWTLHRIAVSSPWVAPAVTVISVTGSYAWPYIVSIFRTIASRSDRMPVIGGYWFNPPFIAVATASTSDGSQSKSGKPWPRFTAPFSAAIADITVKIVVPTWGSLDASLMTLTSDGNKAGFSGLTEVLMGSEGWRLKRHFIVLRGFRGKWLCKSLVRE